MIEQETEIYPKQIVEYRKVKAVKEHALSLEDFQLQEVQDHGFHLSKEPLKNSTNQLILFDFDDTLCGITQIKKERHEMYKEVLKQNGVELEDEIVEKIMSETDKFARWIDEDTNLEQYHARAHLTSLSWLTNNLLIDSDSRHIFNLFNTLKRISTSKYNKLLSFGDDPFYFNRRGRLISRSIVSWDKPLENIFVGLMMNPPFFMDMRELLFELNKEPSVEIGILTYGHPSYQLQKVANLLEKNPDLPISHIFLTRKRKGPFLENLIFQRQPISEICLIDDSIGELSSLQNAISPSAISIRAIRALRPQTREYKKIWDQQTQENTIDFSNYSLNTAINLIINNYGK